MTAEEAYRWMYEHFAPCGDGTKQDDAISTALDALEKQIPIRPIKSDEPRYGMGYDYYDWYCPVCHGFLAFEAQRDKLPQICKCGQRIDWSEDE